MKAPTTAPFAPLSGPRRARPRDFEPTTWFFALLGQQYRADEFAAAIKTLRRTGLIMARFHTCYDVLRFADATGSAYVALVASRKKAETLKQDLLGDGMDPETVSRIRSPAGADIGAVTPEEIALAILADIVRERRIGSGADDAEHARHLAALPRA